MKKALSLLLIIMTITALSGCKPEEIVPVDEVLFTLILGDSISIAEDEVFYDPGFIAKYQTEDISENVTVAGTVNTATPGTYILTYTLDFMDEVTVLTRTVNVGFDNSNCVPIEETTLMSCQVVWSTYLHTVVKLTLYVEQDITFGTDEIFSNVEDILAEYNVTSDKYKDYTDVVNIKYINDHPDQTNVIDENLFDLIEFTLDHQDEVDNLFNAALGPVLAIWHDYRDACNLDATCEIPTMTELNAANAFTDPSKVVLDRDNLTITMDAGMALDLGGVSKGYVSKEILEYLNTLDLHGYLLNNGESNISIGGQHPTRENKEFIIAITDPTFEKQYYATVYLEDGEQLVTSGDYQKYFLVDGEVYHHIISPVSLMPDRNSRSVSIVTSDPALADLYSTAIFLMTIADGIEFVNSIDGLEGIWYDIDGTIHFSENFESEHLHNTY